MPFRLAGRHVVLLNWRDLEHGYAGGAEVFVERIGEQFVAAGARVTLISAKVPGLPSTTYRHGMTIRRGGGAFGVYAFGLAWLARHRRSIDAVIDCQNGIPFFSPLVLRRRTPVVQVLHHVHQQQFRLFFGPVGSFLGRTIEGHGTRLVYGRRPTAVVSPSTRQQVIDCLRLPGPCYLVPNGLDPRSLDAPQPRSSRPTIVCVGRLAPQKRLHLLLDALPEVLKVVPDLTVHVVGGGPCAADLLEHSRALNIPDSVLTWHGYLPSAERDRLLATAWMTVNVTRGEGWGLGVMEAAACGIPAMAFRVEGVKDSIRNGETGWLIDPQSELVDGLVKALAELADPETAASYHNACLHWAGRFTWDRSASLLTDVLSAEAARLSRGAPERRAISHTATVIEIPAGIAPALRASDIVYADGDARRALLYGATPSAARAAMRRGGYADAVAREAGDGDLLMAATGSLSPHGELGDGLIAAEAEALKLTVDSHSSSMDIA